MSRPLVRRLLIVVAALAVVAVVAAVGIGVFLSSLASSYDRGRRVIPSAQAFPAPSLRPSAPAHDDGARNVLLLGSDTRGAAPKSLADIRGQRSDTMLLMHIPSDGKHVYLISIMRDSWVSIPGHGRAKINAAFSYGGVPLTVQVVESLLKVRIDHVAVVSFSGFEGLTDALGGVTVDNAIAFESQGHRFTKGPVTLHGAAALSYVRARYPFQDGDYQRVRNQQAYLRAVAGQLLSRGTLLNPAKLQGAVSALSPYLLVDEGLDAGFLGGQAVKLRGFSSRDLVSFTVPTSGIGTEGDQSVVTLDDEGVADLAQHLSQDSMDSFEGCSVHIC